MLSVAIFGSFPWLNVPYNCSAAALWIAKESDATRQEASLVSVASPPNLSAG